MSIFTNTSKLRAKAIAFITLNVLALTLADTTQRNQTQDWVPRLLESGFSWLTRIEYNLNTFNRIIPPTRVRFYLYTTLNNKEAWEFHVNHAVDTLSASPYNRAYPTRFIIHGWLNNYRSDVSIKLRDALLATGDCNVFVVDWSLVALDPNYVTARGAVSEIGRLVANFIDFLHKYGDMLFKDVTLIGHSLGAHVAGFAGKKVKRGRLHAIIGLDPALPLFEDNVCAERLCYTDANFVESIHTNGGNKGFFKPIGQAAFYPNGGCMQPSCGTDLTGICAHSRAYLYYAEAIRKNNFPSIKCETYEKALNRNCGSKYSTMIKMMVTVVIVFTICWLPFNVLVLLLNDDDFNMWDPLPYFWFAFHWLAMSHSCYNPIIYCYMNARFRGGFLQIIYRVPGLRRCCCLRRYLHNRGDRNYDATGEMTFKFNADNGGGTDDAFHLQRVNTSTTYISTRRKLRANSMQMSQFSCAEPTVLR